MRIILLLCIMGLSFFFSDQERQPDFTLSEADFNNYMKEQNRDLDTIKGLIIYPNLDRIPQDVLFYPIAKDLQSSLYSIIDTILSNKDSIGYITYFQGIRWFIPDLKQILDSSEYVPASCDKQIFLGGMLRIICGKIIFDKTNTDKLDFESDPGIIQVNLAIKGKTYHLTLKDLPKEMGVPKYFKKND